MSEPLLKIRNHHAPSCGDPPIVEGDDPNLYLGYFENSFGEQWVFTFNRKTRRGELRGGDASWNKMFEVEDGIAVNLTLNQAEAMWLKACWHAAKGR